MIKLDAASQTTYASTRNGKTQTDVVDTLVVRYVELNIQAGTILAIIDRGNVNITPEVPAQAYVPAVLDADGNVVTPEVPAVDAVPAKSTFVLLDTPLWVDVRPDGTFASRDGAWSGTVAAAGQIVAGLKQAFDGFLLASGAVTGTAE